jgi:hypothetical protein
MLNQYYSFLAELNEIVEDIHSMKDKTLDHFQEDKKMATKLMIDLSDLKKEADSLIKELEEFI